MDDCSQEEWYQVFEEEYDTYNSGYTDEPLDDDEAEFDYHEYDSPESVNDRRACLWDHSWADGNPRSEATVALAQELIAVMWRLVDEKDRRLQLDVPGVFRCGIAERTCIQGRGWIGQACEGCGKDIVEHIFTAAELDDWFAEVRVLHSRGLSRGAMARYLQDSCAVAFGRYVDAYEAARQCFDGLGDGPVGLAIALTTAVDSLNDS